MPTGAPPPARVNGCGHPSPSRSRQRMGLGLFFLTALHATLLAGAPVFDVREFGARGDGRTVDTEAIQRAVQAGAQAGGGQVRFPPGQYLTGTIRLASHLTLWFDAGAKVIGTTNLAAYDRPRTSTPMPEAGWGKWLNGLFIGQDLEEVTLAGPGLIDGRRVFDPTGEERMRGPHALVLAHCRGVTIRDVTFLDAANYAVLLLACDEVLVRGSRFVGGWDGVHFRGSPEQPCRNIKILNCEFYTGDDAIAGRYWEHTLIAGCVINSSCNGLRLIGPATDLTVHDCLFQGPGERPHLSSRERRRTNMLAGIMLQPGAWDSTRGLLDEVLLSDLTMRRVASPVAVWSRGENRVGRVLIQRLTASGIYRAGVSVESWSEVPITNVVFRDVTLEFDGGGSLADARRPVRRFGVDARPLPAWAFYARNVERLQLEDVRLGWRQQDLRPVLVAENVQAVEADDFDYPYPDPRPEGWQPFRFENVGRHVGLHEAP